MIQSIGPELNKAANIAYQGLYGGSPLVQWSFWRIWKQIAKGDGISPYVLEAIERTQKLKRALSRNEYLSGATWTQAMTDVDAIQIWLRTIGA